MTFKEHPWDARDSQRTISIQEKCHNTLLRQNGRTITGYKVLSGQCVKKSKRKFSKLMI